jgi:raffinose/stachyose/melibiose transport system permease protein
LFQTIKTFGWINSYLSLIGPEIALLIPFSLMITRNFFDEIPDEVLEAAKIDGANTWGQFKHIVLPLGVPILTTVCILSFLNSWNEYLLPLSFINDDAMITVTLSPKFFIQEYSADYNKVFAALVLMSIPIIILYLFGQNYLQRGLTSGAVK